MNDREQWHLRPEPPLDVKELPPEAMELSELLALKNEYIEMALVWVEAAKRLDEYIRPLVENAVGNKEMKPTAPSE